MDIYKTVLTVNLEMAGGKIYDEAEKQRISSLFLENLSNPEDALAYYKRLNFPNNNDKHGRRMYPLFYIPDFGSAKYKTVTMVPAQTYILADNSYELEILRILSLFAGQDNRTAILLKETKSRLKTTCYGNFCAKGECFETSLVALRFINTAFPEEEEWIWQMTDSIWKHVHEKKRHSGVLFYYLLCLSELPAKIGVPEIKQYETLLVNFLSKRHPVRTEQEQYLNPLKIYIARNCLARLPEHREFKNLQPFIFT